MACDREPHVLGEYDSLGWRERDSIGLHERERRLIVKDGASTIILEWRTHNFLHGLLGLLIKH